MYAAVHYTVHPWADDINVRLRVGSGTIYLYLQAFPIELHMLRGPLEQDKM